MSLQRFNFEYAPKNKDERSCSPLPGTPEIV
jgi:hypothetical protein